MPSAPWLHLHYFSESSSEGCDTPVGMGWSLLVWQIPRELHLQEEPEASIIFLNDFRHPLSIAGIWSLTRWQTQTARPPYGMSLWEMSATACPPLFQSTVQVQ
mmetsp:Transcript_38697/g.84783  ORF Transcript_38697/g.84783 Transcript_38697/m.84783 type:complete len:103 (-) Transcript_38697:84-392(-)